MITKEELESNGFMSTDGIEYYDWGNWDVMFDIKTQKLYTHDESYGTIEFMCRVTDITKLVEAYESMFGSLDDDLKFDY